MKSSNIYIPIHVYTFDMRQILFFHKSLILKLFSNVLGFQICKAINLQLFTYDTFRRHARSYLEPAINHKWKKDQKTMLEDLQRKGKIALSGDMRADSPGKKSKLNPIF